MALVDAVIPLAFSLYSVLLSMFSHIKVPVVSLFFSAGAFEAGVGFDLVSYPSFPM